MKIIRNIVIVIVVLLVVLFFVRNSLIKSGVRKAIEDYTGFGLKAETFNIGLFKPIIEIKGLELQNPPDFPEATAFVIRELYVKYDLASLFSSCVHLYDMVVDIPEVVIVQKADGETNLDRLTEKGRQARRKRKGRGEKDTPSAEPEKAGDGKDSKKELRIDEMTVRLGTVEFHRYEEGADKPEIKSHKLDREEHFSNVTDLQDIIDQIAMELMTDEALKELNKWAEEHSEDLEKMGLKASDAEKVGNAIKGFLKGMKGN